MPNYIRCGTIILDLDMDIIDSGLGIDLQHYPYQTAHINNLFEAQTLPPCTALVYLIDLSVFHAQSIQVQDHRLPPVSEASLAGDPQV